ncbi:MAG: hypothetical protein E7271_03365 [Lachnospiraceae bacterium]|nr:hypothetical protein [Lachnospiraceae bacterium]
MKRLLFFFSIIFLLLIFHDNVISGATDGLLLWYRVLVPTLLPFILITGAMSESHCYDVLTFGKSGAKSYCITAFIIGNMCGYPIGAKILNDFISQKKIPKNLASDMLSVSSQASPMFLIGYIYNKMLNKSMPLFPFLIILYIPSIILFIIKLKNIDFFDYLLIPQKSERTNNNYNDTFISAVRTIVVIGVYVMIFSILFGVLLPNISNPYIKCSLSFLEITTGLNLLKSLPFISSFKLPLIMSLSSFGGLCSAYQIKSVLTYENATIKKYLFDKLILSTGTFLLTYLYQIFLSIV